MTNVIPIYITSVQPLILDNNLAYDIFYVTPNDTTWKCLRIYNCFTSFIIARFPGLTNKEFIERYIKPVLGGYKCILRHDLRDSSYFSFDNNYDYYEIIGNTPQHLNMIYKQLYHEAEMYYHSLNPDTLDTYDKLFFENTETPFRFTSTTCYNNNLTQAGYFLACKYNVPLIGGATIDTSMLTDTYPTEYLPTNMVDRKNIKGLNANDTNDIKQLTKNYNDNITKCIHKDESVDALNSIYMLSYDIETYTRYNDDHKLVNINDQDVQLLALNKSCEIMCIGIGLFTLHDHTPKARYCIISKDFDKQPEHTRESKFLNAKVYIVNGEYDINNKNDFTTYIIAKDEKHLLMLFIALLKYYKPQLISAFNNFGFDDRYVYQRMVNYDLIIDFLNCFSPYEILYINEKIYRFKVIKDDMMNDADIDNVRRDYTSAFTPQFKTFALKIDGEQYDNNKTIRSPHVLNIDIYKVMLKEDAKRFTQYGRGNLDSMLETYDIVNPYTNKQLSKTGLKIERMFDLWEANEDIYDIALYCCQDAWICGTLLVKRSKVTDLIEIGNTSNTTLSDSLYRADGVRVANCILGYGYNEKFAVMDNAFEHRESVIDGKTTYKDYKGNERVFQRIGNKHYDSRTIVGGQVRQISAGRKFAIVASDYSSMYPSNKEASNVDSSSRVDDDIIAHPDKYGLKYVKVIDINDMYGPRKIYYVKKISDNA